MTFITFIFFASVALADTCGTENTLTETQNENFIFEQKDFIDGQCNLR